MSSLLFLWLAGTCWGAVGLNLEAPPAASTLGEPLTLKAFAQAPSAGLVLESVRSSTAAFAVLGVATRPEQAAFEVSLLPLDLGRHTFDLVWTFRDAAGLPLSLTTPVTLSVAEPESLKQNPELEDIKPPWQARRPWWPWLLAAGLAAALLLLRRRRKGAASALAGASAKAADLRSPEQRAREELSALERSGLWAAGRHKDFYLRLTEIVRLYLEERRAIAATRLTTTELLRALRGQEGGRQACALIREAFERADLVKFAKAPAGASWGEEDLAAARALIEALAPADLAARPQEART